MRLSYNYSAVGGSYQDAWIRLSLLCDVCQQPQPNYPLKFTQRQPIEAIRLLIELGCVPAPPNYILRPSQVPPKRDQRALFRGTLGRLSRYLVSMLAFANHLHGVVTSLETHNASEVGLEDEFHSRGFGLDRKVRS